MLRPGGIFVNADRIPDDGLGPLTLALDAPRHAERRRRIELGVEDWGARWAALEATPAFTTLVGQRQATTPSAEHHPGVDWHLGALRAAGFTDVGVLWRDGSDAAVVARR